MKRIDKPTILIIVGISGDLARRYLLPALQHIDEAGLLPERFRVIGITRQDSLTIEDLITEGSSDFARKHLDLYKMDLADITQYEAFKSKLADIETSFGSAAQRIFYLSVPPQISQPIIVQLGKTGLATVPNTKLLLEKPFGTDYASAKDLIDDIKQHFNEDQVYRIDHYMAKEMAQNLLVFRRSNPLFARTWNHGFIEKIEISALESIDIEGRVGFYEQTGALRDMVQSHLLQLTALALMDISDDNMPITKLRLRALKNLLPPDDIASNVIRGQYDGYRAQVGNSHSAVETYVSMTLRSKDPRWQGVPITLTTGKSLEKRSTEVHIHYRHEDEEKTNELIMRVQPDEGIDLRLWIKQPGYAHEVEQRPLDLTYEQYFGDLPGAYEHVFVDAMRRERSLFTTSEEVLESWRILEPIQRAWEMQASDGLITYPVGASPEQISELRQ